MEIQDVPDHGYVIDGHNTTRASLLTLTRERLVAGGMSPWDADETVMDRPGLVQRAWWGGSDIGFCGEDHPNAQPVTVVNLQPPAQTTPPEQAAAETRKVVG